MTPIRKLRFDSPGTTAIRSLSAIAATALLLLAITASLVALVDARAHSAPRGPDTPARCPFGRAFADGCASASAQGSFIRPRFSDYARQSGQTWRAAHPQPWNLAGVDYPVGYSTAVPLVDPAAAALPAGCAFQPTGSVRGGARVYCNQASSPRISGVDFSLHRCTVLEFSGNVTGTITVRDNNFKSGPNCAVAQGYLVKVDGGAANLIFEHNQVDGDAEAFPAFLVGSIATNMKTGNQRFEYNAILHSPQRPINTGAVGDVVMRYNFLDGWVMDPGGEHGEIVEAIVPRNSRLENSTYSFNTVLIPGEAPAHQSTTAFYFASAPMVRFVNSTVDHNTVVTNLNGRSVTVAAALAELGWSLFDNLTIEDNYVDPTGALACVLNVGSANHVTGSVKGHTLDVASLGAGALYPGATFAGTGLAGAILQPYGAVDPLTGRPSTGRGGAGTYVLAGPPQSAAGSDWRTTDSPISGVFTMRGNINLRDGSPIRGLNYEYQGAVCHGHSDWR